MLPLGEKLTWRDLSLKEYKHSKYCNYDLTFFYSHREKSQGTTQNVVKHFLFAFLYIVLLCYSEHILLW